MTCLVVCTPLVICGLQRFELSQIPGILEWDYGHAPMIWDSRTHQIKPTLTLRSCAQHAPFHPPKICQLLPWEVRLRFHQISMPNSHPWGLRIPIHNFTPYITIMTSLHFPLWDPIETCGHQLSMKKRRKSQRARMGKSKSPSEIYIYIWSIFLGPICLHSLILILK